MIRLDHPDKRKMCDEFCSFLSERQHAEVSCSVSQKDLQKAATHFFDFLALPQKEKDYFYIRPTSDPRDSGVGYVRKRQADGEFDNKEYFHYHPSLEKRYFAGALVEGGPAIVNFFESARRVFEGAERTLHGVIDILETKYPKLRSQLLPLDERWGSVLRFLKYDVAGKGNFLARGHYDMGACTLALAESAGGLRLGKDNETLRSVKREGDSAFFMTGLNFLPVTDNAFFPTWHDVVQASDDTWNDETARWAIVLFVGARDLPFPSYEATHNPLSDKVFRARNVAL